EINSSIEVASQVHIGGRAPVAARFAYAALVVGQHGKTEARKKGDPRATEAVHRTGTVRQHDTGQSPRCVMWRIQRTGEGQAVMMETHGTCLGLVHAVSDLGAPVRLCQPQPISTVFYVEGIARRDQDI